MLGRIVCFEDDASLRTTVLEALQEEGYEVETVERPGEIYGVLTRGGVGLVLADGREPGMNRLEPQEQV